MIPLKNFDEPELRQFLERKYHQPVSGIRFLAKGVFSRAYECRIGKEPVILRIGTSITGFKKDEWVHRHFATYRVPVADILEYGYFDTGYFFCLSTRLPGQTFQEIEPEKEKKLLPAVLEMLDRIRQISVPPGMGYGPLNTEGRGGFQSWKSYLTNFEGWEHSLHKGSSETFLTPEKLFKQSFLDPALFEICRKEVTRLAAFCPEELHIIHGDFGSDNLLTDGTAVTGVIDWAELRVGDFLYDLATLDLGPRKLFYKEAFMDFSSKRQIPLPHFEERIRCYQVLMIMKAMYLEANRVQREWYDEEVNKLRLLGLVTNASENDNRFNEIY